MKGLLMLFVTENDKRVINKYLQKEIEISYSKVEKGWNQSNPCWKRANSFLHSDITEFVELKDFIMSCMLLFSEEVHYLCLKKKIRDLKASLKETSITCPICFERPESGPHQVFSCGHWICKTCAPKFTFGNCHTCKKFIVVSMNRQLFL